MTTYWSLRVLLSNMGCFPTHSPVPCRTRMVDAHVAVLGALREVPDSSVVTMVFDDDLAPDISVTGNVRIMVKPRTMAIFPEVCTVSLSFCILYKPTNDTRSCHYSKVVQITGRDNLPSCRSSKTGISQRFVIRCSTISDNLSGIRTEGQTLRGRRSRREVMVLGIVPVSLFGRA